MQRPVQRFKLQSSSIRNSNPTVATCYITVRGGTENGIGVSHTAGFNKLPPRLGEDSMTRAPFVPLLPLGHYFSPAV